ncbi:hypothetical protein [Acinetobacter sp. ANC 4779]|uniref:hypothetical protein n=1 Tax=Acinetobacter sp. ANC 4779 TaxID=2529848 RepID=UPI0013F16EFF|nr:hypothetical protein [Acinetobacter sp. ANC 4779]
MNNQPQDPQLDQPNLHIEFSQRPNDEKGYTPPNPQLDQPNQHLQYSNLLKQPQ